MELSKALRTGYYTALNGSISVPVYDAFAVPDGLEYPYVLVSSQNSVQRFIKGCKAYDVRIVLDVVTGNMDPIGMSDAEDISEEIENIVNGGTDLDISANGYTIGNTYRIGDNHLTNKNDLFYIYRKILTYGHIISKN